MSANLVGFCGYLRLNGLKPGMGEQMDALRALEEVDFENETSFRMALRTTLAKSTKEQEIFDEHFHPFWYVWDNAENLYHQSNTKQEESSVITIEHTPKNQSFVSISDWLSNVDSAEEEKKLQVTVLLKLNLNAISAHFRQMSFQKLCALSMK